MKKLILLIAVAMFSAPLLLSAQDEELEKPKDVGVAEFDEFKNTSFSIYKNSLKFKTMAENGDKFTKDDVNDVTKLQDDLTKLQEKTEAMLKNAGNVKPMTKAPKVTKIVKASAKALKVSAENLKYISENMVTADDEDGD